MSKRIGIYSGAFDPIHEGHIAFALAAAEKLQLTQVLIMPEAEPRHKSLIASFDQRLKMTEFAIADANKAQRTNGSLAAKLRAYNNPEPTHTVHGTMERLRAEFGDDTEFTMLLGADVFEYIEKWGSHSSDKGSSDDILQAVSFAVGLRSEDDGEIVTPMIARLGVAAKVIVTENATFRSSKIRDMLIDKDNPKLASKLQRQLAQSVVSYITKEQLY